MRTALLSKKSNIKTKKDISSSTFHVFLLCVVSRQICNLEEQLEQFREELENKSEEVQQLHMQLEIQRKEIISQQDYLETRDSFLQVLDREQVDKSLYFTLCRTKFAYDCVNPRLGCAIVHSAIAKITLCLDE